jgi:hypothetical protein
LGCASSAQDVIVRQRNGNPEFFYGPNTGANIQGIINSSFDGDTIILAGVNYAITANLIINKGVVMIGSGMHPDSSGAYTARTRFIQSSGIEVAIVNNAGGNPSNLELHGVTFSGYVQIGNANGNLHSSTVMTGVKFQRCDFQLGLLLGYGTYNSAATGTLVRSCVIGLLRINRAPNTDIQNSFIKSMTYANAGTTAVNCIFMDFNQAAANNNLNAIYRSNVFLRSTGANYAITEASTFENNLFVVQGASVVSWPNAVFQANNQQATNLSTVFVNNLSYIDFGYNRDYHLVPGPYQTMAFDGGQLGVYGTNGQPMKEGLLPFNPHWQLFSTPGSTSGGTLQNVRIKGAAQTH